MKTNGHTLQHSYDTALRRYLRQGRAAKLHSARRIGRRALALGVDTLDLALVHERALLSSVSAMPGRERVVKRAAKFFAEVILQVDVTRIMALESNARLKKLNQVLLQRTRELAASNRTLKREVIKRKVAQESLFKSEEESNRLLENSQVMQKHLQLLSRRVLSAQEEERKRISRELHDVIAQMLTGINVRLTILKTEAASNAQGMSRKISYTQRLVEKSVDIVHRFARELRPAVLDDLGLVAAMRGHLKAYTKETGIRVNLATRGELSEMSSAKRTALYRVAQEALVNVARHSSARLVNVTIRKVPNAVLMRIEDKSMGFDVKEMWRGRKSQHLGMLGMKERVEMVGGRFMVESLPGKGTSIQARIPLGKGARKGRP